MFRFFSIVCSFGLVVNFIATAIGDDDRKPLDEKAVQGLLERLASPNPKPEIVDRGKSESRPMYAANYDFEKQRTVYQAYKQLHKLSEDTSLFPYLIGKWDDERYFMCSEFNGNVYTVSVGSACRNLLQCRMQPFRGFTNYERRIRLPNFFETLADKEAAQKWWNNNKHQSLQQIQLGVMEWMYAEMEKDKTRYTAEDKAKLMKEHQAVKESGKAILNDLEPNRYFVDKVPFAK